MLSEEMALVKKLIALELPCRGVFDGVTTHEQRREKVRHFVRQVADVIFTIRSGRKITMRDQFVNAYREEP